MVRELRRILGAGALVWALWAALLHPAGAGANDTDAFLKASAGAYAPYRAAVSYLHTGNPGLGALALDAMAARWAALCDRYRGAAPGPFAKDPDWQASLDAITEGIAAAQAKIAAGDLKAAEAALKPIRGLMGDLRRRNGVITHSDRVDAFSAAMETMWVYRRNPPDMADPEALAALTEQAAALRRALEDVAVEPPEKIAADPQFQRLIAGSFKSIATIDRSIEARNQEFLISALRELRSSEQLLWMNFG
jgi:hypothetical protein